ncbi:piggyBac transposable element-derived protein 4-like [Onthophagus taurus]|uniref:piggyBac transposable element-derived protein 4-like n=1 Tax=Onthophagus taurus TaxID=166361 RepID=UPI0039BEC322
MEPMDVDENFFDEFRRKIDEDDSENLDEFNDSCSETEDEILENDNNVEDMFEPSDNDNEQDEDFDSEYFLGKDLETMWTNKPLCSKYSRTSKRNLVLRLPGPKGGAKNVKIELECFSLFFTDDIIKKITTYTNEEIITKSTKYTSQQWFIGPTNEIEICAVIGLLLKAGFYSSSMEELFSVEDGPPLFRAVMTFSCFKFLLYCLRFDSKTTREERRASDKFAAFREVWDLFISNCKENYTPSEYVTVDETLLSFRGRAPFKMYLPSKPDKYGLKIISLCDAKTFNFCGGIPYVGKETRKRSDFLLPTQYVLSLIEPIVGTNRNVTTDNWFTSLELARALLDRKLTLVGTLRKNKREVPPHMLDVKNLPLMTARFLYSPDETLLSFSKRKNCNVLLLSTMHRTGEVDENTKVPEIINFYNHTKGGVDVFDMLCHKYTTARKTNRWPMRYLYGILDAAAVNAFVIFKFNHIEKKHKFIRSEFLKKLAMQLLEPQLKLRNQQGRLPRELNAVIRKILKIEPIIAKPTSSTSCEFCTGTKKDRKGTSKCSGCDRSLCAKHRYSICPLCVQNVNEEET